MYYKLSWCRIQEMFFYKSGLLRRKFSFKRRNNNIHWFSITISLFRYFRQSKTLNVDRNGKSSATSRPLNVLYHSHARVFDEADSPQACCNIFNDSAQAVLLATRNLRQTLYSRFSSIVKIAEHT